MKEDEEYFSALYNNRYDGPLPDRITVVGLLEYFKLLYLSLRKLSPYCREETAKINRFNNCFSDRV